MKYLALFFFLLACTPVGYNEFEQPDYLYNYAWGTLPTLAPLPPRFERVATYEELEKMCRQPPNSNVGACADRQYNNGVCVIYYVTLTPYLDWHERKHCAGYNHK